MPGENQKQGQLKESLQNNYLLILRHSENFEERFRLNFRLWQFYAFTVLSVIILSLIVSSLIIFTPAKKLVPGYGKLTEYKEIFELHNELDQMKAKLNAQQNYIDRFAKMITNDVETEEDVQKRYLELSDHQEMSTVEKIKEDEEIRQDVEREQVNIEKELVSNSAPRSGLIPLDRLNFIPPIKGNVSAEFQPDKKHIGIDIIAPKNTPIKAVLDGHVISSDYTMESGNTIALVHDHNLITFYKHNSSLLKKIGDKVKAGEAIAIIGNTGELTSGPHLHFELWQGGRPLNPAEYMDF